MTRIRVTCIQPRTLISTLRRAIAHRCHSSRCTFLNKRTTHLTNISVGIITRLAVPFGRLHRSLYLVFHRTLWYLVCDFLCAVSISFPWLYVHSALSCSSNIGHPYIIYKVLFVQLGAGCNKSLFITMAFAIHPFLAGGGGGNTRWNPW